MINVFVSYSHADEAYKKKLELHLSMLKRTGYITCWNDRLIKAGDEWDKKISENLLKSDLILLLISPDFMGSKYCYEIEVKKAIELHKKNKAIVVPIILRYCDWKQSEFEILQCLPTDAKPINSKNWENEDAAFLNVIEGLKEVIKSINSKRTKEAVFPYSDKMEFKLGGFDYFLPPYIIENNTFVGIDFGTSTTVISIVDFKENGVDINTIPIEFELANLGIQKSHLFPSVIYYDDNKNNLLYGFEAKNRKYNIATIEGVNYWSSFKIHLGKDEGNIYTNSLLNDTNSDISILNPKHATKEFFKHLKKIIESYIQNKGYSQNLNLCISIPASFEANQRYELLKAIEESGFSYHENLFIDEPNAAFLSFLYENQIENKISIEEYDRQYTLVFDFGAGTCDISILEFGKKNNGFYSKNIAISKFEKLGGDDIDKQIAKQVILPEFCEEFDIDIDTITDIEYVEIFEPKFKASAEALKIRVCDRISKLLVKAKRNKLPDASIFCEEIITIKYKGNDYLFEAQTISFNQFIEVMQGFTTEVDSGDSIFYIIDSALQKAKMDYDDIDNVLLIGGSCKNPIIVNSIKDKFTNSKILIPNDLQSQVSKGTAINSVLANGLNTPPIAPIVSETISIKLTNDIYFPIISQGEEIPHFKIISEKLTVQRNNQQIIELPLYVSGDKKMLQKITITSPEGFLKTDKIKISSEIDKNKIITIKVIKNDTQLKIEQFSPFSNEVLTPYKRVVKETERDINNLLSKGFTIKDECLKEVVDSLITIHAESNNYKEAMELSIKYFPSRYSKIAYYADCAGYSKISTEYTFKAYEEEPNDTNAYNLALEYENGSSENIKYLEVAVKLGNNSAKVSLANHIDDSEQSRDLMLQVFDNLYSEFKSNPRNLTSGDFEDLVDSLDSLEYFSILDDVNDFIQELDNKKSKANKLFIEENLLKEKL
ncbi:Hsp70 family protein [Labilibaculum euxinus]